ncbi:hypothetical protein [Actinomycetospora aeridis]|uniref:Uncharacterized protein n=1 Tax=Actinomycetospora aeridis TaxID=3129231 RepID=A0ABU8NCF1_9PSEU
MTDESFHVPGHVHADEIAAADPGLGAPGEAPGFGEHHEPDVFPDAEPGDDTLDDELRGRPAPPFRTPHPEH